MTVSPIELPPQAPASNPLEEFDDLHAYNESLQKTLRRADEIVAMQRRGLTEQERKALKTELPALVRTLRHLLKVQMDPSGTIVKADLEDGSYDNADTDNQLRSRLGTLRNLDVRLNRMFGTRTIRNLSSTFTEDLPNWFGVKWRQAKDNLKHLLKTTAVVGGISAAGLLAGYGLYHGSLTQGATVLGQHAGVAGSAIGSFLSSIPGHLMALKTRIFG
jgi:hypothetical protein